MVAIVSGNSLGLNLTSKGVLGGQGVYGDPTMGQGGEQVYVNAPNGNLVMQQLQDQLVGAGLDVTSMLTYNSLGLANDDNGDNFSIGKAPMQLQLTTGPVNGAGSVLTRTAFDGSQTVFTWDASNSRYIAVNGTGAFDTITYAASKYTWVDGATQTTESYDGTTGRLLTRTDAAGNALTFGYDATSGFLTSVTDANGEVVTYVYSGNLLQQVKAPVLTSPDGTTSMQPVISYFYDDSNRLKAVTVDLSPDGSTSDGNVYSTNYTYDGSSKRVQTVTQSDGTKLTFGYDGSNRVSTITDALNNLTTFTYDTTNRKTTVTANGQATVYAYSTSGQLLSVTAPAVNGVNPVTQFGYNASGEVTSIIDADNHVTTMTYDAAGNQLSVLNSVGDLTTRVYDSKNRLITETTAMAQTPALVVSSGVVSSAGSVVKTGTASAWDASVRSVAAYSGAATVAFTATSSATRLMVGLNSDPDTSVSYQSIDFALYTNAGTLQVYTNGSSGATIGTYVQGDRLSVSYDGNGHVNFLKNGQVLYTLAATPTQPLYADTSFYQPGASIANLTFGGAALGQTTRYVYSADGKGLLRYKISVDGRVTEYGYNALGQLTSTNEYAKVMYSTAGLDSSTAPSEATMNSWRAGQDLTQTQRTDIGRDARQQVQSTATYTATAANGTGAGTASLTTYIYDPSGRLLQTIKPGAAKTTIGYDGLGRIKTTTDTLNRQTTTAYTDATGTITVTYASQLVTTSVLDKAGRLLSTTNVAQSTTLSANTIAYDSLGHVLRTTDATGVSNWYLYDADGRKVATVDGNGALTEYVYDKAGLVTETIAYATPINTAALVDAGNNPKNPALSTVRPTFNASTDHRAWTVYDGSGRVSQTIDAVGAVTQFNYDGSDQLTSTCTFATKIDVSALGSSPSLQFVATSSADRIARNYYDGDGHLTGSLDPDNYLTVYQYDAAGQRAVTIRYATKSPAATDQSTLGQLVPASVPADQRTVTLYDMEGRVTGQIDALGYLTQTFYNPRNTVDHVTRYATPVGTSVAAGTAVDSIKPTAASADTTTSFLYDDADRVKSKTDPAGVVNTFTYDPQTDALISSTVASNKSEAATTQTRYDALGRAVAVLDGVGSALITAGMTQAQIDAVWAQHATTTVYDAAGRRTSTTNALGKTTLYFYDANGQVRFTVDPLHYVKELRYDAFGHVSVSLAYAAPIAQNDMSGIGSGGFVNANLLTAVSNASNIAKDAVSRTVYDADGRVALTVGPTGAATSYVYDASGNVTTTRQYANAIATPNVLQVSDPTGQMNAAVAIPGTFTNETVTVSVRFKGSVGQAARIALQAGSTVVADTGWAAGTNGWVTLTLSYTPPANTPTAVTLVMQTGAGATTLYDDLVVRGSNSGLVWQTSFDSMPLGTGAKQWWPTSSARIVQANSLSEATDAQLLAEASASADPARDLITRHVYDADGRVVLTVDPTGAATAFGYDANGNVTTTRQYANAIATPNVLQVSDPTGQMNAAVAIPGTFTNETVTVSVRFKGSVGQAARIALQAGSTVVADTGWAAGTNGWVTLTLTYTPPGNTPTAVTLVMQTGAGATTLYDDLVVRGSTSGLVWQTSFDSMPLGTGAKQWWPTSSARIVQAESLSDATDAQLLAEAVASADPSRDLITRRVYDADDRVALMVDPTGAATGYTYDANGNVTTTRQYANVIATPNVLQVSDPIGQMNAAVAIPGTFTNETVTVSVRFKGTVGQAARIALQAGSTVVADTGWAAGTNGWVTLTLTYTPPANTPTSVTLVMQTGAGATTLYDDLVVRGSSSGLVWQTSFDSMPLGTGAKQWWPTSSARIVQAESLFDATDAQLLNAAAASADPSQDRTVNSEYDADGRMVWTSPMPGIESRVVYDGLGRPVYAIAADGAVTRTDYDADSQILRTTTFAITLDATRLAALPHAANASQVVSAMASSSTPVTSSPSDRVSARQYDVIGRLRFAMDGAGAVSEMRYDDNGNVVDSFTYATRIDPTTWSATIPPTVTANPLVDRHTHASYDAMGNVIAQADGTGAVVVNSYDNAGQLTDRTSYANRIAAGSWTSGQLPSVTVDPTRDIHERFVHDTLGRLTYSADGTGAVTAVTCDADGRITSRTALATLATSGQPLDAVAVSAADRVDRFSYDTFGRQVWHLDATGALDFAAYDAEGRVVQTIGYAQLATSLPAGTVPLATTSSDRIASTYYNTFGQVTYTVDPLNRVSLTTYDKVEHAQSITRYANAIAAGAVPGTATIVLDANNDQSTSFLYDAVGRVKQRTDAMGGQQGFVYDGTGNKISLVDEKTQTWSWTYDANGRELTQTSPQVSITSVGGDGLSDLSDTTSIASIVTAMVYDGVGNLVQRTDDSGRTDARATTYGYDAAGHQISVQGPAFDSYDYQGHRVSTSAPVLSTLYDAFGNVVATVDGLNHITYTTYDQANRVDFMVNQLGYVTGNARNAFGDVLVQTRYGAPTTLIGAVPTSAANAPTTASVASVIAGLSHGSDRVTTTAYDGRGRAKSQQAMAGYFADVTARFTANAVESGATPTTNFQYDAFGDLVLVQQLVNQAQGLYASTYHYFDNAGQETDTIGAMGYQTHRSFDSFGNTLQTVEYANAKTGTWSTSSLGATPTTSGDDRTTTDQFDRLNRKTTESRTLDYSASDDGVITGHSVTTSWGYDAQGHVTRTTDVTASTNLGHDVSVYRSYDALGQLRGVVEAARSSTVDGSTITPVTEYSYDAFGEATMATQRFNTATGVSEFTGAWTSSGAHGYNVSANTSDRITRTAYDAGGHAIQVDDPMAATTSFHTTFNRYDANGRLVYTKHDVGTDVGTTKLNTVFHGSLYDAAGQVITSINSAGTDGHTAFADQTYDAFGEIVVRGIRAPDGTVGTQEVFKYDNNGHVWLTNSGSGVYTAYVYDLQGNVTSQMVSQGVTDISGATSITDVMAQVSGLRVTKSVHDLNGNVVRIDEPTRSTVDAGVTTRVGATSWAVTQSGTGTTSVSGTPNILTLSFNSLAGLGSGQVRITVNYTSTNNTTSSATFIADSDQALTSYVASWTPAANPGINSTKPINVTIEKKSADGTWHSVISNVPTGASKTQIEVDAPDDPRSTVSFSYTIGGSTVPVGLTNFGNAYSFDSSGLAAGSYTYTTTVTAIDGSTTTHTGSFTVGSGSTVNGAVTTTQVTPSIFQTFDRWGNLLTSSDPRNAAWLTTSHYNSSNQLISQAKPGLVATQYFYDQAGRQVATKDGNGNVSGQKYDQAGHVVETDAHADVNTLIKTVTRYDIFGRAVQSVAANGFTPSGAAVSNVADFTTQNTYDANDNLLSVQHGIGAGNVQVYSQTASGSTARNLVQTYTYDSDGHRLSSWDGTVSNVDGSAVKTLYAYDAAGHLVDTTLPATTGAGALAIADIKYVYDDFGHMSQQTDAKGAVATWKYDYFGSQLLTHKDFGGNTYQYGYDKSGDLLTQTSTNSDGTQNLSYAYDAAGNQTQITDSSTGTHSNGTEVTKYVYDLSGRHVQETVSINAKVYQDNHIGYDAAGRMVDSSDESVHVSIQYDNAGNRLFIGTHVLLDGATNLGASETDNASDGSSTQYFSYDGLNRQLHVSWNSLTSIGAKGHTLSYDADGNRLTDTFSGNALSVVYDPNGTPTFTAANGSAAVTETYAYDADDRLSQMTYGVNNSGSTQQILVDTRHYDGAGRLLSSGFTDNYGMLTQLNKVDVAHGIVGDALDIEARSFAYDERGEVSQVVTYTTITPGMAYATNVMTYAYDEAGNKVHTNLSTNSLDAASNVRTFTDDTTINYAARESYLETGETSTETSTLTPSTGTAPPPSTASYSTFTNRDANGSATQIVNGMSGNVDLVNDAQGRVLSSVEELGGKQERNLIVDSQDIGQYGVFNDPGVNNKLVKDFSFTYKSLEDQSMTSGTSTLVAQGSESLADLAGSIYGDRQLWRRIAAANGYSGNGSVQAGQRIMLAGNAGPAHNDESTFRSYDPASMISTQTPYAKADTGTMTLNGSNPMSLTDQEQSDYSMDVYGKNYHKFPFTSDKAASQVEIGVSNGNEDALQNGPAGSSFTPEAGAHITTVNSNTFVVTNSDGEQHAYVISGDASISASGTVSFGSGGGSGGGGIAPMYSVDVKAMDYAQASNIGVSNTGYYTSETSLSTHTAGASALRLNANLGRNGLGLSDSAIADWSSAVDQGINDKAHALANFDEAAAGHWNDQAAKRQAERLAGLDEEYARADAYHKQLQESDRALRNARQQGTNRAANLAYGGDFPADMYGGLSFTNTSGQAGSFQDAIASAPAPVVLHGSSPYTLTLGGKVAIDWDSANPPMVPATVPKAGVAPSDLSLAVGHTLSGIAYSVAGGATAETGVGTAFFGAMAFRDFDKAQADLKRATYGTDDQPVLTNVLNARIGPDRARAVDMVLDVVGLLSMLGGSSLGNTAGQATDDVAGLFRRTENVGDFADLKVPMQMRYVEQAAEDGGVGLQGVKVRIVRDPDLLGKNLYGYTHPNGSIDLYPDAFTDTEQLVKTLGHERTHTMQIDIFGHPNTLGDEMMPSLMLNEQAAHGIEDSFWQYYLQNNSGKLEQFR